MDRRAILDRLTAEAPALRAKYGVRSLAVFGSMARGDDREGSDVDVLVTFEGRATFDNFMGLKLDLEDLFGRSVDLLTPNCLSPEMEATIGKEALSIQKSRPEYPMAPRIRRHDHGTEIIPGHQGADHGEE